MNLKIQIFSLIYSFGFGLFFSLVVNMHYNFLFSKKKWFRILINFIFVIDMSLLYFLILKFINGGILHLYFYLLIFFGFLIGYARTKKLRLILQRVINRNNKMNN